MLRGYDAWKTNDPARDFWQEPPADFACWYRCTVCGVVTPIEYTLDLDAWREDGGEHFRENADEHHVYDEWPTDRPDYPAGTVVLTDATVHRLEWCHCARCADATDDPAPQYDGLSGAEVLTVIPDCNEPRVRGLEVE